MVQVKASFPVKLLHKKKNNPRNKHRFNTFGRIKKRDVQAKFYCPLMMIIKIIETRKNRQRTNDNNLLIKIVDY
jgi:hypothetical protein